MSPVFSALQKVFQKPAYIFLALVSSFALFAFTVWLPNLFTVISIFASTDIPFTEKFSLPIAMLGAITTNFTPFSAFSTIVLSVLFGINLAMVVFYLRRKVGDIKQSGIATGFLGILSAIFGTGCAACGSLFLTGVLPSLGAGSALSFLHNSGEEFGILGIALLAISISLTAKQIQNPAVCRVAR